MHGPDEPENPWKDLREHLARRQRRRERRRWVLRWRRKRLLLALAAIERRLADAPDDRVEHLRRERERVQQRVAENEKRLYR
jgi:hypothetical protein